jgi:hypothetical protein
MGIGEIQAILNTECDRFIMKFSNIAATWRGGMGVYTIRFQQVANLLLPPCLREDAISRVNLRWCQGWRQMNFLTILSVITSFQLSKVDCSADKAIRIVSELIFI